MKTGQGRQNQWIEDLSCRPRGSLWQRPRVGPETSVLTKRDYIEAAPDFYHGALAAVVLFLAETLYYAPVIHLTKVSLS